MKAGGLENSGDAWGVSWLGDQMKRSWRRWQSLLRSGLQVLAPLQGWRESLASFHAAHEASAHAGREQRPLPLGTAGSCYTVTERDKNCGACGRRQWPPLRNYDVKESTSPQPPFRKQQVFQEGPEGAPRSGEDAHHQFHVPCFPRPPRSLPSPEVSNTVSRGKSL